MRGQTSSSRYQAILSGNVAATVLSQPFSIQAQDAGMRTLAMASETIKDWVDTCIVVNTTWAAANRPLVRAGALLDDGNCLLDFARMLEVAQHHD